MPDADVSAKAMRERVLGTGPGAIPYDGHVFALTDPVTKVATAPHADVPMLPWDRLPEVIRWRYLTRVNRADTLIGRPATLAAVRDRGTAGVTGLATTSCATSASSTPPAVAFADRYGAWGYLELLANDDVRSRRPSST